LRLTEAGDVTLVPVPGHTPGARSAFSSKTTTALFFAGDSSYTQDLVLRGRVDGVGSDDDAERLTHERIRASAGQNGVASTYSMERELPSGRAVNELEVVASERPREFAIRTTAGPTPFHYRYQLSAENGETVI
jgi:hypothetical protein